MVIQRSRKLEYKYEIIGYLKGFDQIKTSKDNINLFFYMTPLSDFPDSVHDDVETVQIYSNTLFSYGFYDDSNQDEVIRAQSLKDFLEDYLIICTLKVKKNEETGRIFYQGNNVQLVRKSTNFSDLVKEADKLVAIPYFSKNSLPSVIGNEDDFEKNLLGEKIVGRPEHYSKEAEDYPEMVIWENDSSTRIFFGEIIGQTVSTYGVQYQLNDENKYKLEVDSDGKYSGYDDYKSNDMIFIPSAMLYEISVSSKKEKIGEQLFSSSEEEIEENKHKKAIKPITLSEATDNKSQKVIQMENTNDENAFMERFIDITRKQLKLFYEPKDLFNFHTAMKGDSLVVLSGLSGTGKSQLVNAYAKALQLGDDQLRFISVRPFWADDSDLLGYADTVNSVYRPGDSGLIDALIAASHDRDNLYMICFDEMNLARVEHYFSQFLSVLELDTNSREVSLYNEELENRLYNSSSYPSTVDIFSNVLFVGTINTDESTHQFSDKVLDRSNIISLELLPFSQINEDVTSSTHGPKVREQIKYEKYRSFKKSTPHNALTNDEKEMLWQLHLEINKADKNIGIGWRIVKQMDEYLQNLPKMSTLSRSEAIDKQIVQRILSKIRGSEEQLTHLIGKWDKQNNSIFKGSIESIFDSFTSTSSFTYSREIILQKAKELNLHGFTI